MRPCAALTALRECNVSLHAPPAERCQAVHVARDSAPTEDRDTEKAEQQHKKRFGARSFIQGKVRRDCLSVCLFNTVTHVHHAQDSHPRLGFPAFLSPGGDNCKMLVNRCCGDPWIKPEQGHRGRFARADDDTGVSATAIRQQEAAFALKAEPQTGDLHACNDAPRTHTGSTLP
eukprot:jgi/Ulvmu1/133/UM001_0137.1